MECMGCSWRNPKPSPHCQAPSIAFYSSSIADSAGKIQKSMGGNTGREGGDGDCVGKGRCVKEKKKQKQQPGVSKQDKARNHCKVSEFRDGVSTPCSPGHPRIARNADAVLTTLRETANLMD